MSCDKRDIIRDRRDQIFLTTLLPFPKTRVISKKNFLSVEISSVYVANRRPWIRIDRLENLHPDRKNIEYKRFSKY